MLLDNAPQRLVDFLYLPYRFAGRAETAPRGGLCLYALAAMLTNVYIDGLNLYYRAVRGTEYRWLNLRRLAEALFPQDTIGRVHYFTTVVLERPDRSGQQRRQRAYLRALETLQSLDISYGAFRSGIKTRPLARPAPGLPRYVEVWDSEEKGTDVNLAVRLLVDGFQGSYEQAVVISNDSDFAGAMRYVRDDLRLRVVQVNPDLDKQRRSTLVDAATYVKRLRRRHLAESLFPDTLTDANGVIRKPAEW